MKRTARFSSLARLSELVAGFERVVSWLSELSPEDDEYLSEQKKELEKQTKQITASLKKDRAYSQHEELDALRDNLLKLLFKLIDGYTAHPDAKIAQSAKTIFDKISKKYSSIARANYEEESGLLSSMFGDFETEEFSSAVKDLSGVSERLSQLKTAQENFEKAHKVYIEALKAEKSEESATSIKKKALYLVNDELVPYLSTMRRVKKAQYEKLAQMIEGEIQNVNDKVVTRSKNEKKA